MPVRHTIQDKQGKETEVTLTPIKAIRIACKQCSNWNNADVKRCPIKTCGIYPFRMGKNPGQKGKGKK